MSFIKYISDPKVREGNGRGPLHFSRANIDGLPYRGEPMMLREDEMDDFTEVVCDGHAAQFDVTDPEQLKKLEEIIDKAANNWWKIYYFDRAWSQMPDRSLKCFVFVVWAERVRELAPHKLPAGLRAAGVKGFER